MKTSWFVGLNLLVFWFIKTRWLLKFILLSPRDGTSIILSDDVGQLYILSTGQGESQKDAKYDQVHMLLC